mmetsp:Transcript_111395/g.239951  ORF Transcript_111395/g.239951 Transcript_111395/m.239951 type:complete len:95 (+) Transcript_111395:76-360(+)
MTDSKQINGLLTNIAVKGLIGSLAFVPACVVFRTTALRCTCGGMGMGFGAGFAWAQSDIHVRHPNLVAMPQSFPEEMGRLQACAMKRLGKAFGF